MKFQKLKVGADVEGFLHSAETEKPVPVCGLLGGTKDAPLPVLGGGGFAVQEDNVAVEFNVPAADTLLDWVGNFSHMREYLGYWSGSKNMLLSFIPLAVFTEEQLMTEQAQRFGCDPDFCVHDQEQNYIEFGDPVLKTSRFAGGHIHISFLQDGEPPNIRGMEAVVRACDLFLGAPLSLLGVVPKEIARRKFYGKAGSFRPKMEYGGIEYRSLSGAWCANDYRVKWVWNQIDRMFLALNIPEYVENTLPSMEHHAKRAINEGDMRSIRHILDLTGTKFADLPA